MQGQAVASCDSYGIVKIWDIRLIAPIANINVGPHPANKIAFDSSGTGGVVGVLYYPSFCLICTLTTLTHFHVGLIVRGRQK